MSDLQQKQQPAILIPGFDGREASIAIISGLLSKGYPVIAVCEMDKPLVADKVLSRCTVINSDPEHALRTGLEYFQQNMEGYPGVVVLDMDEGYALVDVLIVAEALDSNPDKLVIASRTPNPALGVLARMEKWFAWLAFAALHGRPVKDPWAGLKAIPAALVSTLCKLKDNGKKLEFNMLLNMQRKGIKAVNVPVSARYTFADGSDFFGRLADIFKILLLLIKFLSASLASTVADNTVYLLITRLLFPGHWIIALTFCRSAGALTGYLLNRNVVFRLKNNTWQKEVSSALKFALLALFNYGATLLIVGFLHKNLLIHDFVAKLMSDVFLFATSYTIQREFIFHRQNVAVKK
jgi:putative flippase GtrA